MAARVDASIGGGFDWLKLPDSLETHVSTRLASYGQVLSVHVTPVLLSNRYTATVSMIPAVEQPTEQLRAVIAQAFSSWNGIPANVTITSRNEPAQQTPDSPIEPITDAVGGVFSGAKGVLIAGAVVLGLLVVRDATR